MIKKLHEIRLKDIILLDVTKSPSSLKRYRFVPVFLIRKNDLEALTHKVFDLIGGKTIDNVQDEFDKLLYYRNLQLLEALYRALSIEVDLKARVNAWKIILDKDYKDSEQLQKIIDVIKEHTGIEIVNPDSIKEFKEYVQHKADKYREMYPANVEHETVSLSKVIYSVFNYLSEPYNENMRLITFVELKHMAEERVKQNKTSEDNGEVE